MHLAKELVLEEVDRLARLRVGDEQRPRRVQGRHRVRQRGAEEGHQRAGHGGKGFYNVPVDFDERDGSFVSDGEEAGIGEDVEAEDPGFVPGVVGVVHQVGVGLVIQGIREQGEGFFR